MRRYTESNVKVLSYKRSMVTILLYKIFISSVETNTLKNFYIKKNMYIAYYSFIANR